MILYLFFTFSALVILMWANINSDNVSILKFILHCITIMTVIFAFIEYINSPKAIDVYRGKTTLQITYRDSIPIDSLVVFK